MSASRRLVYLFSILSQQVSTPKISSGVRRILFQPEEEGEEREISMKGEKSEKSAN